MKRMPFLKGLLLIPLFLLAAVSTATALPTVEFEIPDSYITENEFFNVNVLANFDGTTDDYLLGFGFDVLHESNLIFSGYTIGPDFDDIGLFGPDVAGATKIDSLTDLPTIFDNALQNVLLATLTFQAGSAGTGLFDILGDPSDLMYGFQFFFSETGLSINDKCSLTINASASPVPEPATMLLFGTGLAGIGFLGRKRARQ